MENNIDKLFKSKMGTDIPEFDPLAWDKMQAMIEDEQTRKPKGGFLLWGKLLGLGVLILVSVIGLNYNVTNEKSSTAAEELAISGNITNEVARRSQNRSNEDKVNQLDKTETSSIVATTNITDKDNNIKTTIEKIEQKEKQKINRKEVQYSKSIVNKLSKSTYEEKSTKSNTIEQFASRSANRIYGTNIIREEQNTDNAYNIRSSLASKSIDAEQENNRVAKESNLDQVNTDEVLQNDILRQIDYLDLLELKVIDNENESLPSPIITITKPSRFTIGILGTVGYNNGFGFQVGPNISYAINNTYSLISGVNFELSDYDSGPQLILKNKVYSFGSQITEKTFALNRRTSVNVPLMISRGIDKFNVSAGISANINLGQYGSISQGSEINPRSAWVTNDSFKKVNINYHLGTSFRISRRLSAHGSLEYRPSLFTTDAIVDRNNAAVIPRFGIEYLIIKN